MAAVPLAPLEGIAAFLENYWCRNQVFRTGQFGLVVISGLLKERLPAVADKLLTASNAISTMRTTLRLLDDLPALVYAIKNLQSKQTVSWMLWGLELLGSLSGQLYYPVEHIAWAADLRLISTSSYHFWTMAVVLWGISLLVNCIQNILFLIKTSDHRHRKSKPESASTNNTNSGLESVRVQRHMAVLTVVESLCDLMNAVHWLPDGILWSGKLPLLWVGLFGSVSSLIGLYKISSKVNLE